MVELIELKARLQTAHAAFDGRDFALAIEKCDDVIRDAARDSDEAKDAAELRRHASEHELLARIANATDYKSAIPLIDEAITKKRLRYDLAGQALQIELEKWKSQRSTDADAQATQYLEDGKKLENQQDLDGAQKFYQQAGDAQFTSSTVQEEASNSLQRVESAIQRRQDYQALLKLARDHQVQGNFEAALDAARQAIQTFHEDPRQSEALVRELEGQVNEAKRLAELLTEANQQLERKDFEEAITCLSTAQEIAHRLNLPSRAEGIAERLADAQRRQEASRNQVQNLLERAEAAVNRGDLPDAANLLTTIRDLDPLNPDLPALEAQLKRNEEVLEAVQKIKDEAARLAHPRDRLQKYQAALALLPDDPQLLALIAQAHQTLVNEAMEATNAELDLGFDTPGELEQGKLASDGRVLVKGMQQWVTETNAAEASRLNILYRQIFGRIAVQKLREYIATRAIPEQHKGHFAAALQAYDQALHEWGAEREEQFWLLSTTVEWSRDDGDTLQLALERKALKARLEIVKKQRQLVAETQEVYPAIAGFKQSGDAALNDRLYNAACQNYENALQEIIAQEPGKQMVLEGVRNEILRNLSISLRYHAQVLSQATQEQRRQAERMRDLGELEQALNQAEIAKDNSRKLTEMRLRFEEITPKEQQASWAVGDQSEATISLYQQIEKYRRYRTALQKAQEALEDGEYGEAEVHYREIDLDSPWGTEARERLNKLPKLKELRAGYEQAQSRKDYVAALDLLGEIISQDGHSTWVEAARLRLMPSAEKQRRATRLVAQAGVAIQARNYLLAVEQLEDALREAPGHAEAETLLVTARQKQSDNEKVLQARKEMVDAYQRGEERGDYETALARAKLVLADNPEDETARRIHKVAQDVIDLSRRVEQKEELQDWPGAQNELDKASYLSSNYIFGLQRRIGQKLSEQANYEDLLIQARSAYKQKDWGTVLAKACLALQKPTSSVEPRNLANEAREQLVRIVKEKTDPRYPVSPEALAEAENAAAAIRMAEGEKALTAALGDVAIALSRARQISKARNHLASNEPSLAYEALTQFADRRGFDQELDTIFREAEYAAKRKQALDILGCRPINYAAAAELLKAALTIKPQDAELQARLDEARLEAGLKASADALRQGQPTDAARQYLLGLPLSEPRVVAQQDSLDALEKHLGDARLFFQNTNPQHDKALESVDEALKILPGYTPAEEYRLQILQDVLDRADKAENAADFALARRYYHLARERGSDEIRKRGRDGIQSIDEMLENKFREKWNEVKDALEDPDLTEGDRSQLQAEFSQLAILDPDRQERVEIIQGCVAELKNRSDLIRQVEKYLDEAENALETALNAPTFALATERLTQAAQRLDKAANVDHYGRRTRIVQLRDTINGHKRKREEAQRAQARLNTDMEALLHPPEKVLSPTSVTPEDVAEIYAAGERLLETAIQDNVRAKELDPKNTYLVREWQTQENPDSDPLVQQAVYLKNQKTALTDVSNALQTALRKRKQASEQDQKAQQDHENAIDDETFKSVIAQWARSAANYKDASDVLRSVQIPANSIPHIQSLHALRVPIITKCEAAEEEVQIHRQNAQQTLGDIVWKRQDARRYWDERGLDRKARGSALDLYNEILELNPRDSEAIRRVGELRREIIAIRNQNNSVLLISLIVIFILLAALVSYLTLRPGGYLNPYTPTPTMTATSTPTLAPTSTLTVTPSPTSSPVPTSTPTPTITATPILSPTPWLCEVAEFTVAYREPNSQSNQARTFSEGDSFFIVGVLGREDDERIWLMVYENNLAGSYTPMYVIANEISECWHANP